MESNQIAEVLLESIQTLIDSSLNQIKTDETAICTITDISERDKGKYKATQNGSVIFDAYSEVTTYRKDEQVVVLIPKNDTEQRQILSRYITNADSQGVAYVSEKDKTMEMHIAIDKKDKFEIEPNEEEQLKLVASCDMGNQNEGLKYNTVYLKADFINDFNGKLITSGNYGLDVQFYDSKKKIAVQDFLLDSSMMFGNPYDFMAPFTQEIAFHYDETILFDKIYVYFYQLNNFKYLDKNDGKEKPVTNNDIEVHTIEVHNVYLSFGYDIESVPDNTAKIFADKTISYDPKNTSSLKRNMSLVFYNKDENNKYLPIGEGDHQFGKENSLKKQGKITQKLESATSTTTESGSSEKSYVFRIEGVPYVCTLTGADADKYKVDDIVYYHLDSTESGNSQTLVIDDLVGNADIGKYYYSIQWFVSDSKGKMTGSDYLENLNPKEITCQSTLTETKVYAIVWCNGNAYKSNEIVFKNQGAANKAGIDLNGIKLHIENGANSKDNYNIYDGMTNMLYEPTQANVDRELQVRFESDAEIPSDFWTDSIITWSLSDNSMISQIESGDVTFNARRTVASDTSEGSIGKLHFTFDANQYSIEQDGTVIAVKFSTPSPKESEMDTSSMWFWTKTKEHPNGVWHGVFNNGELVKKENLISWSAEDVKYFKYNSSLKTGEYSGGWELYSNNSTALPIAPYANKYFNKKLTYRIKPNFYYGLNNNKISCTIKIPMEDGTSGELKAEKEFTFSSFGSSGTDYTIVFTKGAASVEAKVVNKDGKDVDTSVKYKWIYDTSWSDEPLDFTDKASKGHYLMLQAKAQVTFNGNQVWIFGFYGIPLGEIALINKVAAVPTTILYDNQGVNPTYYKGEWNTGGASEWNIVRYHKDGTPVVSDTTKEQIINDKTNLPLKSADGKFIVPSFYSTPSNTTDDAFGYCAILLKFNVDGQIKSVKIPIYIGQNQYQSALLNNWDGSLQIDTEGNYILSAMLGAGHKDNENRFTGVIMGDRAKLQENDTYAKNDTGLFAFSSGVQTFALDTDGTVTLGASGYGQIIMDGTSGVIESGNYEAGVSGMQINLEEGIIDAYNFKLNSDGIKLKSDPGQGEYYLEVGKTGGNNYIKFDANGNLDIRANSFSLTSGTLINSNLLTNASLYPSSKHLVLSSSNTQQDFIAILKNNTQYTFSCKFSPKDNIAANVVIYKSDSGTPQTGAYIFNNPNVGVGTEPYTFRTGAGDGKYTIHFWWQNQACEFWDIKLEEGAQATPWVSDLNFDSNQGIYLSDGKLNVKANSLLVYNTSNKQLFKAEGNEVIIGGWNVNAEEISKKIAIDETNYYIAALCAPNSYNSNNTAIAIGQITNSNGYSSARFRVTWDGKLKATNAEITGDITANAINTLNFTSNQSSTTIGGWTVNSSSISSGKTHLRSSGDYRLQFGDNFKVKEDGTVEIVGGKIKMSDLTFSSSGIRIGDSGNIIIYVQQGLAFGDFYSISTKYFNVEEELKTTTITQSYIVKKNAKFHVDTDAEFKVAGYTVGWRTHTINGITMTYLGYQ